LAATVDRAWRAQGVDAYAVIRAVEAHDRHAAASLRLMQAFGLRLKGNVEALIVLDRQFTGEHA
jgi:DMSO/TMAO reductase YedYZ molybdopterin-dependent catalytic subunit